MGPVLFLSGPFLKLVFIFSCFSFLNNCLKMRCFHNYFAFSKNKTGVFSLTLELSTVLAAPEISIVIFKHIWN